MAGRWSSTSTIGRTSGGSQATRPVSSATICQVGGGVGGLKSVFTVRRLIVGTEEEIMVAGGADRVLDVLNCRDRNCGDPTCTVSPHL